MAKTNNLIIIFVLSCISGSVLAAGGTPLSEFSETLLSGGHILTKIMWAACIIVGIILIAAAFTQFQIHRRNSKLVPLTTPVLYLILGIAAIAIPFIEHATGFLEDKLSNPAGKRGVASSKKQEIIDIDAPLN